MTGGQASASPAIQRGVIYVLVGTRHQDLLRQSVRVLRAFDGEIPVVVHHDADLSRAELGDPPNLTLVRFEPRSFAENAGKRNSNLRRFVALLESPFDVTAYMDNDLFIVDRAFFDGFEIARHFGLALPANPRAFLLTDSGDLGDLEVGADVSDFDRAYLADMPRHMLAYNTTLMFHPRRSRPFVEEVVRQLELHPSRGQAALARAIWTRKEAPHALPVNWMVGRRHMGIERPITLHVGQREVHEWWRREFEPLLVEAERAGTVPRRAPEVGILRRTLYLWKNARREARLRERRGRAGGAAGGRPGGATGDRTARH